MRHSKPAETSYYYMADQFLELQGRIFKILVVSEDGVESLSPGKMANI